MTVTAGVTERTGYRRFPDRDALLEGLSQRLPLDAGDPTPHNLERVIDRVSAVPERVVCAIAV
jgi:hypothetical protein